MKIEKVLDVISEVYSEDHRLILDVAGPCGIEACTGAVEIDLENLDELYIWAERNKK